MRPRIDPPDQAPFSQSPVAADRGATMSDVIKAVTDQFALINVDSDADLRAVGAALCQIPEGMSPLSEGFTSFRHEVLHAILMTGEAEGLSQRAVVLNKCLTSIEDSPDLAEQGIALQILAEELREDVLTGEAANSDTADVNKDDNADNNVAVQSEQVHKTRSHISDLSADEANTVSTDASGDNQDSASFEVPLEFVPSEPARRRSIRRKP